MKKPDFFFIGAPKCGTTTIANWLREHPRIFMTQNPKEPMFFDTDIPNLDRMSLKQYERLFSGAGTGHLVVGEASTSYLRSDCAVQNILAYSPEARFLVVVRNPVEMAPSVHGQLVYTQTEDIEDFNDAWRAQGDRAEGRRLPARSREDASKFMYADICSLGRQVERLYQQVTRDRVKIVFMDDMRTNPRAVYLEILDFLGVPDDGRTEFSKDNVRKRPRFSVLSRALAGLGMAKGLFGLQGVHSGMLSRFHSWNQVVVECRAIDAAARKLLIDAFRDDVELLASLTGRDLSGWLR